MEVTFSGRITTAVVGGPRTLTGAGGARELRAVRVKTDDRLADVEFSGS
jgi:hypothetical protein